MATPITTSSAGAAGSSAKTFRISDVPNDWDKEKLESCMGNYFQTVSIQSLAPRIDGRSGQATAMLDGPVQNAKSNETSIIGGLQWDTDFYGMTTLFAPPPEDHKLDIIVVSGLGGHAFGSFKERGGSHMWLRDSLPYGITDKVTKRPMARVIVYGHRSHVAHSTTIQGYSDISASFLHSLRPLAAETPTTPIMFIGHSLGGIIIKQDDAGKWHMNGPKVLAVSIASARYCPQSESDDLCACDIQRTHSDIVKFSRNDDDYDKVQSVLQDMARHTILTTANVAMDERTGEYLRALWFEDMNKRSTEIAKAVEGTCIWVFQEPIYTSWVSASRGLLWIKGNPGTGKSTLIKHMIQHVRHHHAKGTILASFFFHDRGTELERTRLGFYRSILHQLLQQVPGILHDLVDKFHETKVSQGKIGTDWHWREQDLAEHLASAISKSHALWLFVDALDEGGAKTANDLIEEFTALIDQNCASNGRLHICFTCRRFPILRITGGFELAIDECNKPDIRTFVQSGLSRYHCLLQAGVADSIIDGANGIFLWARLAVDEALRLKSRERTPRQIYKVIKQMPKELEELFVAILSSKSDEPAESLLLMQWICFAALPISLKQLRWAIVTDADRPGVGDPNKSLYDYLDDDAYIGDDEAMGRRIVVLSCGLAEVTRGRVQFIHQAVKEFFLDQGLALLRSKTELEDRGPAVATVEHKNGHLRLARTCLQYMWMFNRLEFASVNGWRPNMKDFKNFAKIKPSLTSYPYSKSYRDAISHRAALINEVFGESWVGFLPLLWYADKCWMQHVAESEANVTRAEDSLDYPVRPPDDFPSHRSVLQKYFWESKHLEHLNIEDSVAWAKAFMQQSK
ncbi:hypothetical protein MY4824_008411 [Beauveria thailandica]